MIALLQRVVEADVKVNGNSLGHIGRGLLAFIGVEREDTHREADRLLHKLLGYRIFPDEDGRMNLGLRDIDGELLLVPQFTLAADTRRGMRPSFTPAAPPVLGEQLFDYLTTEAQKACSKTAQGQFGADMQVALINDGPVTFWLQVSPTILKPPGNCR